MKLLVGLMQILHQKSKWGSFKLDIMNCLLISFYCISDGNAFRVFRLQIVILNTHLNGRDTHIRQVKVYSVLP